MGDAHVLIVTLPNQGNINPSLQFAKRLVKMGVKVTFSTCVSATSRMAKDTPSTEGLTFFTFSDGHDNGWQASGITAEQYFSDLTTKGSEAISELITNNFNEGLLFTHAVYTPLLSWVAKVAKRYSLPSTLLWVQPATILDIYYYSLDGYLDVIANDIIELPGLPRLNSRDLPSFLLPSDKNIYNFALQSMEEQFDILEEETRPKVLVNTFEALESEALNAIEKFNLVAVGPLIPSAFLDGKDPSDTSFGGDLFQKSKDYVEWLKSKPDSSVIYVSFGSLSVLSMKQMQEMAKGLLATNRPFLWVIRAADNGERQEDKLSCKEELEQKGIIVPWCSQVEVLSHPAVGCFVTHCGWNSSVESLASGVPMVMFPQWTDQATNAKLIEDIWKTGVRLKPNEDGLVEGEDIRKSMEIVMGGGERGEEMKKNAKKWKELAREAFKEGGSSDLSLKDFVDQVRHGPKI